MLSGTTVGSSVDPLFTLGVDPVCSHADSTSVSANKKAMVNGHRLTGLRLLIGLRVTGGRGQTTCGRRGKMAE